MTKLVLSIFNASLLASSHFLTFLMSLFTTFSSLLRLSDSKYMFVSSAKRHKVSLLSRGVWKVINIDEKKKWTKDRALGNTTSNIKMTRVLAMVQIHTDFYC